MAKASCEICLSPALREEVNRIIREDGGYPALSILGQKGAVSLADIPDCPEGSDIGCLGGGPGKKKSNRAPSPYNLFVKECMSRSDIKKKPQPERMGACAVEWKNKK